MSDHKNDKNDPNAAARKQAEKDAHRDPLSRRADQHPVGALARGAAAGGIAGGRGNRRPSAPPRARWAPP